MNLECITISTDITDVILVLLKFEEVIHKSRVNLLSFNGPLVLGYYTVIRSRVVLSVRESTNNESFIQ